MFNIEADIIHVLGRHFRPSVECMVIPVFTNDLNTCGLYLFVREAGNAENR